MKDHTVVDIDQSVEEGGGGLPLDPKVAALCTLVSDADPCGPDLDVDFDSDYINFFASVEGILPSRFFSDEDGSPFDRSSIDIPGQLNAMKPLLRRTRDLRLLILQARLYILNKDLGGFAQTLAATAWWLDKYWNDVHPRPEGGSVAARASVVDTLDLPTVVFPMQYAPLVEARRLGQISYRSWMIAKGDAAVRTGEPQLTQSAITDAIGAADPAALADVRKHIAMIKASLDTVRNAFYANGEAAGLDKLAALVKTIQEFIDPQASAPVEEAAADAEGGEAGVVGAPGAAPATLAQARAALAAIAGYYSRSEPSSPILLLVRQAHDLIGKSFFEVVNVLVPGHIDRVAFQIGGDRFFDLPLERLSSFAEVPSPFGDSGECGDGETEQAPRYTVASRGQALALLDQVHQYFRRFEPSSPVPMLCERARTLAEQNFMDVLRNVLPKDALKNINSKDDSW